MKLKNETIINAIIYYKKTSNTVVLFSDMNMSFNEYNIICKFNLSSMLNLNYTLKKIIQDDRYIFKWFLYQDEDTTAQFVELVNKK